MCATVRPERWDDVREVCERWGLPVAVIGRVTDDGDIAIIEGGSAPTAADPGAGVARVPPRPDQRRDRPPAGRRAARPSPRRAGPRRAAGAARSACRSGGWTRAPCSWRSSAPRTSRRAAWSSSSTTPPSGRTPSRGPGRGAAVLRVKGTTKALVATTDGNQSVGALDPCLGRRAERRRGDPQRRDHRRPAARRHQLPQLRRPDPARGVLAAPGGRPRPRRRLPGARPARDRRQRLALQRVARRARSPRRPRSASSGCSTTSTRSSGRRSGTTATRSLLVGEATSGLAGLGLRGAGRGRRRGRAARARPRARGRAAGASSARPSRAVSCASAQDVSGGGLAVALAECGDLEWPRRQRPGRGRQLAGRRALRREPVAPRRHDCRRATRAALIAAGAPARPAGRGAGRRRRRPARDRARRRGRHRAPPRSAAAGSPTRWTCRSTDLRHAWEHGLPRALGWEEHA